MEQKKEAIVFTEDEWGRCDAMWHNRARDILSAQENDRQREILNKAFRGFVVEFVRQMNSRISVQEITRNHEKEERKEEYENAKLEIEGDKRALTFHCISVLNRLTAAGCSEEQAYNALKVTIKLAVAIFDSVTNPEKTRDFPMVPIHTPKEEHDKIVKILFEFLDNIQKSWGTER